MRHKQSNKSTTPPPDKSHDYSPYSQQTIKLSYQHDKQNLQHSRQSSIASQNQKHLRDILMKFTPTQQLEGSSSTEQSKIVNLNILDDYEFEDRVLVSNDQGVRNSNSGLENRQIREFVPNISSSIYEENAVLVEDIVDDSDEERSIKQLNMFQIGAAGGGQVQSTSGASSRVNIIQGSFPKIYSEHDFLMKEQARVKLLNHQIQKNKNMIMSTNNLQPCGNAMNGNRIQLIVRIRPFLITEQLKECLKVVNVSKIQIHQIQQENGIRLFKDFHQIHFKFDDILMPKDSQEVVFSKLQSVVQNFLMGINGTIFAYGQTGAGKTYSIMGGSSSESSKDQLEQSPRRGILPRTLDYVFLKLQQLRAQQRLKVSVSFYEIYNEKIYDLLGASAIQQNNQNAQISKRSRSTSQKPFSQQTIQRPGQLDIREEKDGHFTIPDLKRFEITSIEEAYMYLDKGLQRRATSSTSLNNQSSRSHSIFQIYYEKEQENGHILKSKIRIVDLAGSEKYTIKKDLPPAEKNIKVQELTSINSSLSALGQCITALSDPSRKHIPFRNSKLTKVLKDSLDENSNVCLIICISPSIDSYKETLSTLQFADRAKKAILDGRNFSESKLLAMHGHPLNHNNQSESLSNILKAYQEEKAIRKELEQYVRASQLQLIQQQNHGSQQSLGSNPSSDEVYQELERLKKQNTELQLKVKQLEMKQSSTDNLDIGASNQGLKSCLKKTQLLQANQSDHETINITIKQTKKIFLQSQNPSLDSLHSDLKAIGNEEGDLDENKKRVRFAEKLDNDQCLDSDMRERIEHNLKYNDDTIFDNISIFRELNDSGLILKPPKILKDKKDVHPSLLLKRQLEKEQEELQKAKEQNKISEQDEQEEDLSVVQKQEEKQEESLEQELMMPDMIIPERQDSSSGMQEESMKEFWAQQSSTLSNRNPLELQNQEKSSVSPIQKHRPNNSSYDLSKDLIDLDQDQVLKNRISHFANQQYELEEISEIKPSKFHGDKTIGANRKKAKRQMLLEEQKQEDSFLPMQHSINIINQDEMIEQINFYDQQDDDDDHDQSEDDETSGDDPKDYHVCDASDQIFQPPDFDQGNPELEVSQQNEPENLNLINLSNNAGNLEENQNTLLLDSQSMIIDDGNNPLLRQTNGCDLSQIQMQSLEASSILQHNRDSMAVAAQNNVNQMFFSLGGMNPNFLHQIGNTSSQGVTTDVLTYSLTNTFSTIESLHEELAAIRNGIELSQRRGNTIMKTIHQYAREISEFQQNQSPNAAQQNDQYITAYEEAKEDQNIDYNSELPVGSDDVEELVEEENLAFIRDIKGFYSRIHQEIAQLKTILIDSAKNNQANSPLSSRKHMISEQIPPKSSDLQLSNSNLNQQQFSINDYETQSSQKKRLEQIDYSQQLITVLKREMQDMLQSQYQQESQKHSHRKPLKVLDLLEQLQQSLAQAAESPKSSSKKQKYAEESKDLIIDGENSNLNLYSPIQHSEEDHHHHHQHQQQMIQPKTLKAPLLGINMIDPKTMIQYEELPSAQESPLKMQKQPESKQRTPEIFKSLAKLDESEVNSSNHMAPFGTAHHGQYNHQGVMMMSSGSTGDKDMIFSSSQQTNYQNLNQHIYFSQHSQQQQDMQITLRSYPNQDQMTDQNGAQLRTERKRPSVAQADNTLTLIFDSDDEDQAKQNQSNSEENEECGGDNSPIFKDDEDSKIERQSSNANKTNNNIQNSNSFQADNSLIFFANNIIIGGINNTNDNSSNNLMQQQPYSQPPQQDIYFGPSSCLMNSFGKPKQRNQSQSMSSKLSNSVTPERELKSSNKPTADKKANSKYLMPSKKSKFSSDPNLLLQNALKPTKSHQEHLLALAPQGDLTMSLSIENSINKSTSKNSVHKYWNQFFNNNQNKSMKQQEAAVSQSLDDPQLNQQNQQKNIHGFVGNSRNQGHSFISRSAYQSNSFKEDI